jgi:hypothetical protein
MFQKVTGTRRTTDFLDMYDVTVVDSDDKTVIVDGIHTHNSDCVISLFRDEAMLYDNEIGMRITKLREGIPVKILLHADFHSTNFDEIRAEAVDDEQIQLDI